MFLFTIFESLFKMALECTLNSCSMEFKFNLESYFENDNLDQFPRGQVIQSDLFKISNLIGNIRLYPQGIPLLITHN